MSNNDRSSLPHLDHPSMRRCCMPAHRLPASPCDRSLGCSETLASRRQHGHARLPPKPQRGRRRHACSGSQPRSTAQQSRARLHLDHRAAPALPRALSTYPCRRLSRQGRRRPLPRILSRRRPGSHRHRGPGNHRGPDSPSVRRRHRRTSRRAIAE